MAEAVFADLVGKTGLTDDIKVDSAGTAGYHIGEAPHPGTQRILAHHHIQYRSRARQIKHNDLRNFDYIIALDSNNQAELKYLAAQNGISKKIHRLLDFAQHSKEQNVPDPYYTGNFEYVYQLVLDGCQGLLNHIRDQHNL